MKPRYVVTVCHDPNFQMHETPARDFREALLIFASASLFLLDNSVWCVIEIMADDHTILTTMDNNWRRSKLGAVRTI